VNMAMHRWVPKRHHVLLIVCVEEEPLHVWLQSEWKTDCVWAISSLQNEAVSLCECLLSTEGGRQWEVESRNFVLIRIQRNWGGEGLIRFCFQSPLNAKRRRSTFLPDAPRFPKQQCIYKVLTFRPFALLKTAACRLRGWGTAGTKDTP
jgi:hypothetical protein